MYFGAKESSMVVTSIYPVVMSRDVAVASRYFQNHFGFEVVFESDWYVSLRHGQWELAFVDASHPTIPEGFRTPSQGLLINIEVDDVDAEYQRLVVEGGQKPLLDIRSEDFGQRHFILRGPDNVLVDVITPIPMTGEFAGQDV
jgi:catechol 2,3-dioxygenase-like lactoylglutathione lyase family enzyme